ncbi:squalene/phytoene synthase family protein, partial [Pseudomonas sp. PCH446]
NRNIGSAERLGYQEAIFPQVSRSFALTIPQLPPPLNTAMTTAYLLCRIADTIEDDPALSIADKQRYEAAYIRAVLGEIDAQAFCDGLSPCSAKPVHRRSRRC